MGAWLVLGCHVFGGHREPVNRGALAQGQTAAREAMKSKKWILFALALGMMSATAGYLWQVRHTLRLGPPGVLVGPDPIYDDQGRVAGQQSVILPETVLGAKARRQPITEV